MASLCSIHPPPSTYSSTLTTRVVSHSPAACQHLLDLVQRWLQWSQLRSQLRVKVPKCHSLGIQASTGRVIDPKLSLGGQITPQVGDQPFKFLGMPVQVPQYSTEAKSSLNTREDADCSGQSNSDIPPEAPTLQARHLPSAHMAVPGRRYTHLLV